MESIVIPSWVLNGAGVFVGSLILSGILFKLQTGHIIRRRERKEQKEQARRNSERRAQQIKRQEDQERCEIKRQEDQEFRDKELLLDRLLPGPWRTFYEFLHGHSKMTRQAVLLTAITFKSDVDDIPKICPVGFDMILQVSYYNLNGKGSCHEEFTNLLSDHVEFPKNYDGN